MKKLLAAVTVLAVSTAQAVADDLYTAETRAAASKLTIYTDSCVTLDTFPDQFPLLISAMTYDPSTDTLFGAASFGSGLYEIDRDSGEMTLIGANNQNIIGLAIQPTTFELYGMSLSGTLYTLDKADGTVTPVGSDPAFRFPHGLGFASDGTLYASDTVGLGIPSKLYTVDPGDGDATFVATINRDFVVSLDFGSDGQLYGIDNGTDALITIDLVTGNAQTICLLDASFSHTSFALIGCLQLIDEEIVCHADGTTFTVNIEGLNACTGGMDTYTFTASGGAIGEEMCFTLLVDDGGFCCTTEICVTIPDCTPAALPSDLNGDGLVGIEDFLALLAAWGSCSDCGTCPADFDGDCSVGILDLLILLGNWG